MPAHQATQLLIASIRVGERLRAVGDVAELVASIADLGLLNPITVTGSGELIAGAHRLQAARQLGWTHIPAVVLDVDPDNARMAEIDENLVRSELSALERAEHLAERKRIYEARHPGAKHGGDRRTKRTDGPLAFAVDAGARLGESPRNVRRYVAIAEALSQPQRDALRSHRIAGNLAELKRLARLPESDRGPVVAELAAGARTVKEAQREVVARAIRKEPAPLPQGPFRTLVIDPPWPYETRLDDAGHRVGLDYPSMTLAEIEALPLAELVHEDAVLWLWATNAFLHEAHHLAAAWGFTVKTTLTWDKGRIGTGDWLRGQTEHCLLAARGAPVIELAGQSTLLAAPRRENSRKPDEFYALVDELCPGSKVELFAREPRPGWFSWGAEVERFAEAG